MMFQHTAARRRLLYEYPLDSQKFKFQHTAARRRLVLHLACRFYCVVSTHSRPKAAGALDSVQTSDVRFNTQPPEGGCVYEKGKQLGDKQVSTHSRPKAAVKRMAG